MLHNHLVSIGKAALLLGVSVVTIRRWCKIGKLTPSCRTIGNHRRFSINSIQKLLGYKQPKKCIGYARVSSHDQKQDLIRQADRLKSL